MDTQLEIIESLQHLTISQRDLDLTFVTYPVNSSMIEKFYYNRKNKLLVTQFTSKKCYIYFEIPEELLLQMCAASSVGIFFNQYVKSRFGCPCVMSLPLTPSLDLQ